MVFLEEFFQKEMSCMDAFYIPATVVEKSEKKQNEDLNHVVVLPSLPPQLYQPSQIFFLLVI